MEMSTKEFMNLSDSEIKNHYLNDESFYITNFYLGGKLYTHEKCREIKLKKPYPTLQRKIESGGGIILTITYRTKKIRIVVEGSLIVNIDREGYDFRYTADRDS